MNIGWSNANCIIACYVIGMVDEKYKDRIKIISTSYYFFIYTCIDRSMMSNSIIYRIQV